MPHVFDRGMSTASSTGIGLGLARAFVEADGGRLELRRASPPVFGVFLAVDRDPATADESAGDPEADGVGSGAVDGSARGGVQAPASAGG